MICGYQCFGLLYSWNSCQKSYKWLFLQTERKLGKKKKSYISLALPQSTSFGQYHSNMEFYLSNQILHTSLKETASEQNQWVTRQPHLPHSSWNYQERVVMGQEKKAGGHLLGFFPTAATQNNPLPS